MAHIQCVDELVKEYLLFRGFISTAKVFDGELKSDKDRSFRVDKLIEQLLNYITTYDLTGLHDLWVHLDLKIFSRLEQSMSPSVKKLESSLYKMYLVNAHINGKQDRVLEFFDKLTSELTTLPDWKDWFVFPFVKNPEEHPTFDVYFTRTWQDTLLLSLHNFMAIVFQSIPLPSLCQYEDEVSRMSKLQEENAKLKEKLSNLTLNQWPSSISNINEIPVPAPVPSTELMDDFYVIAQEAPTSEGQLKAFKSLIRNFGSNIGGPFQTSPVLNRRSSPVTQDCLKKSSSIDEKKKKVGDASPKSTFYSRSTSQPGQTKHLDPHLLGAHQSIGKRDHEEGKDADLKFPYVITNQDYRQEHGVVISQCKFNPSGKYFCTCDMEGMIRVWSVASTVQVIATVLSRHAVTALAWLHTRDHILVYGTKSGSIRFYDVHEKKILFEFTPDLHPILRDRRIMHLCSSYSEYHIACAIAPYKIPHGSPPDGKLILIDIRSHKIEHVFNVEPIPSIINTCCFNHNDQLLLAGSSDGKLRFYDLRQGDCIASWQAHQGETISLQMSSDETYCYSLGTDGKLMCWSLTQTGKRLWESALHEKAAGPFLIPSLSGGRSLQHRPYGKLFCVDSDDQYMLTCSNKGGVVYKILENGTRKLMSLCLQTFAAVTLDWFFDHHSCIAVCGGIDGRLEITRFSKSSRTE